MAPKILVEIVGDADKLTKELKKAGGTMSGLGKVAGVAGAAITTGLVVGLKKSADAAIDAQKVQAQTEAQLKSLGISYSAHAKQIDSVVQKTSKLAAVDDEELQQSFTRLLPSTRNVSTALKQMGLAADVSRAQNISLEGATKLLLKANTGSAGALKKLGISSDAVHDAQRRVRAEMELYIKAHGPLDAAEKLRFQRMEDQAKADDRAAQALKNNDVLQKTFAGSAEAYGKSAAGAQARLSVAIENVQESLGTLLLPVITKVANAMANLAGYFETHTTLAKVLTIAVGALGGVLLVASVATKIMAASQVLLNIAMSANPIGVVILALVALGVGLKVAWGHSETFRNIVTGTWNAVKNGAEAVLGFFRANWPIIATLISGPFAPIVALATNAFGIRSALVGAFNGIKGAVAGLVGDIVDFWRELPGRIAGAISAGAGKVKDAVLGVFSHLPGFVKKALGISSPSTVFMSIGEAIISGAVKGIQNKAGDLVSAAWDAFGSLGGTIGGAISSLPGKIGGSQGGSIVGLGRALQGMGFQVSENPFFGGVSPVHAPGSYHYQGRAIDVNWPGGGPVELAHLQQAFSYARAFHPVEEMIEDIGRANQHLHVALGGGGIVTQPTMALIGERGPEAVIPLSKGGIGGGGGEVHYHYHGTFIGGDRERLARELRDATVTMGTRSGGGMYAGQA
jgi:hypothetical protein